jgi:hypothetical protein
LVGQGEGGGEKESWRESLFEGVEVELGGSWICEAESCEVEVDLRFREVWDVGREVVADMAGGGGGGWRESLQEGRQTRGAETGKAESECVTLESSGHKQ